jgi:hypothetical protein
VGALPKWDALNRIRLTIIVLINLFFGWLDHSALSLLTIFMANPLSGPTLPYCSKSGFTVSAGLDGILRGTGILVSDLFS